MTHASRQCRRGVALVTVLWIMTVICAVALQVSLLTRLRLMSGQSGGEAIQTLFLARAGVERAFAQLDSDRDKVTALADLREAEDRTYSNVELGAGTYTLAADPQDLADTNPAYGIADESAKLNLNTASEGTLRAIRGMPPPLAAAIVNLRKQKEDEIADVAGLLALEGVDETLLFGEDRNRNGILDPGEDDGRESWPPDNADGRLDRGLVTWLTCVSAARNVSADGSERVDITQADASKLQQEIEGLTEQQARSIVEHRKSNEFSSIADLLDVKLVRRKQQSSDQKGGKGGDRNQNQQSQKASGTKGERQDGNRSGGQPRSQRNSDGKRKEQYEKTDQDAFTLEQFKAVADRVTVSDEEVLKGRINVNTAPERVLACLENISDELAAAIVARRKEAQFESIADLLDVEGMTEQKFKSVCDQLTARSDVFSVRSWGVLTEQDGGVRACCCIAAVIDRTEDETRVRTWRELY